MKPLMAMMSRELNLFFLALSFFSRIPVPKSMQYSPELLNQSNRYFSLVGLLLGVILVGLFWMVSQGFGITVSVLLVMVASLLLTGAFHEDGLADMADGIGGGYTVEKRLAIMKDSCLGTYGVVSVVSVLALKFCLLVELAKLEQLPLALIAAYALSRAVAASLIVDMPYVSEDTSSKSKPLAEQQSLAELAIVLGVGLLPLLVFSWQIIAACIIALFIFRWLFKKWLMARINGFTGDCLGAAQQIAELIIYLLVLFFVSSTPVVSIQMTGAIS